MGELLTVVCRCILRIFFAVYDSTLREECLRPFDNWKKQTEKIHAHEKCNTYKEAKAAQVLFKQNMDIESPNWKQKFVSETRWIK